MILSVAGIRFSYNSHPVLENVGFDLAPGEVLGVLGVNGAGKSTLLKCINRILRPQAGSVLLADDDLLALSRRDIARRIGYVAQRHGEARLTVYETVLLGRRPHMGWAVTEADYTVVETVVRRMGLAHLAHRYVDNLSGGECQKVMIARALAQSPKVLLLDEPTASLDLKNQLDVLGLIRDVVADAAISAVISIHDLNLAMRFADRLLFLRDNSVYAVVDTKALSPDIVAAVYGVAVEIHEIAGRVVVVPV